VKREPRKRAGWTALLLLALLAGLGPASGRAGDHSGAGPQPWALPDPLVPLKERILHVPMTVRGPAGREWISLEATLYLPDGPGPFPLVVMSHGTPRNVRQRRTMGRRRYNAQSWEFVSMGLAVVIPMRRGYGHSAGDYAEEEGFCDRAQFYEAGMESAKDLRATVEYLSRQPYIDPQRIVLVGYSSGGFASLALASQGLPGIVGVISFAGGRGSMKEKNCSPAHLEAALARFGRTTRVPTLWIYAENDTYFPPWLAREMYQAFRRAGGQGRLVMLPPFAEEGHFLFSDVRGLEAWRPVVNDFLNTLGFPGLMPKP
jgi:dienelactone hydrolase